jgi:hypothetical protein
MERCRPADVTSTAQPCLTIPAVGGNAAPVTRRRALDELAELAERRHRDPARAQRRARQLARGATDDLVAARADWVIGLTQHELGQAGDAVASYGRTVDRCLAAPRGTEGAALAETLALARASMAISCLSIGDADRGANEIELARRDVPDSCRGQVEMLYGLFRQRTGHLKEAQAILRRALRQLEQVDDQCSIARLRLNRGILRAYQGDLVGALDDLGTCEELAQRHDLPVLAAMAAHNLGFTEGRLGNLPDALAGFDRAEAAYARLENPARLTAVLLADRCEVLLLAGLVVEAGQTAREAVAAVAATGDLAHLSETRLLAARALLADGAYGEATDEAALAADQFDAARRRPWAALARYVGIQAEVLASQDDERPPLDLLGRSRQLAVELEQQGWPIEAVHVRTFVGRLALALGRPAVARRELAGAAAARRRGPAEQRAQAWHAAALLCLTDGDQAGARRALVRGLGVIDRYRATLGATELRTGAAGHGTELARLGTRLALADGRPAGVLQWAERGRARALAQPAVRPPGDPVVAAELVELRQVDTDLRDAAADAGDTEDLRRRATALEDAIRRRARQARPEATTAAGSVDLPRLRRAVGDRVLVEYLELDGELHAVVLHRGRLRHHQLGPTAAVEAEKDYLLFALRRLLLSPGTGRRPGGEGGPDAGLADSARALDQLLVAPLELPHPVPGVIVVPTGTLYGVAWSALPGLAGCPTTVAPSAALWLGAAVPEAPRTPSAGVALIAGPGLPGARAEVRRLGRQYPEAEVLVGRAATVEAVLGAIERADVVHVAAHGSFRADSPLFSSIRLADGPLTVYDLEQVARAPRLVVLSACEAASVAVRSGDEPLGTAATLLELGVDQVIAPVMAVPDDATRPLMVALHRHLAGGAAPAAALARAAQDRPGMAAATFVCVGGDDGSLSAR